MGLGGKKNKWDIIQDKQFCFVIYHDGGGGGIAGWKLSQWLNDTKCMVNRRQDCEETGELLFILVLYVLVHLLAWYHDSLRLMLKFQACPIKMKDLLW
jgi:hypothetical protein